MTRKAAAPAKIIRCAIYTRKSSEEGLDQSFNSLHAQREACEAYVKSQVAEGWKVLQTAYDDGGFSGGNLTRPGLEKLLAGVDGGRIDIVVVYKVDRLTRSLSDFAKIVDRLDAAGASFVSVTQAFNTTNSMGRLTWTEYPGDLPASVTFIDPQTGATGVPSAWPCAAGLRPPNDICANWTREGYQLHPEWLSDLSKRLVIRGNALLLVLRLLQHELDCTYTGRFTP